MREENFRFPEHLILSTSVCKGGWVKRFRTTETSRKKKKNKMNLKKHIKVKGMKSEMWRLNCTYFKAVNHPDEKGYSFLTKSYHKHFLQAWIKAFVSSFDKGLEDVLIELVKFPDEIFEEK